MSGSGREVLGDFRSGWESLPNVRESLGGTLKSPRVVGTPSWLSVSGRDAIWDVREWSRGPPRCLGVVATPSGMSGSGHEALLDVL